MLRVLLDIKTLHGIPPGTMRSAISRGLVRKVKKGKIVMVDDEEPDFLAYKQTYYPRKGHTSASSPRGDQPSFSQEHTEVLGSTFS